MHKRKFSNFVTSLEPKKSISQNLSEGFWHRTCSPVILFHRFRLRQRTGKLIQVSSKEKIICQLFFGTEEVQFVRLKFVRRIFVSYLTILDALLAMPSSVQMVLEFVQLSVIRMPEVDQTENSSPVSASYEILLNFSF